MRFVAQARSQSFPEPTLGFQFRLSISIPPGSFGLCNQLYPLYQAMSVAEALHADIVLPKAYYRLDNYNTSFVAVSATCRVYKSTTR